jgi:bacteriorhodopsin
MKKLIVSIATFLPAIAFAQPITDVNSLTYKLTNIGNTFIQILIAFAVIWIIYNVVRFIIKSDAPEERKEIGKAILWSIVGLFIILSIWGLVRILTNTFRTDTAAPTNQFPQVQYPSRIP